MTSHSVIGHFTCGFASNVLNLLVLNCDTKSSQQVSKVSSPITFLYQYVPLKALPARIFRMQYYVQGYSYTYVHMQLCTVLNLFCQLPCIVNIKYLSTSMAYQSQNILLNQTVPYIHTLSLAMPLTYNTYIHHHAQVLVCCCGNGSISQC